MSGLAHRMWRHGVAGVRALMWDVHARTRSTVTVDTRQGRLTVRSGDAIIGRQLYCEREFELILVDRVMTLLRQLGRPIPGGTVLDVGANMGVTTVGMLHGGLMQRAIAIEPEPTNVALLQRNVAQNGLGDRVVVVPCAASHVAGTVQFELSDDNFGDHRIRLAAEASTGTDRYREATRRVVDIGARPLDQILEEVPSHFVEDIALLWVDTQGHEAHVFAGAERLLAKGLPTVAEVWPYGLRRAGVTKAEFCRLAERMWSTYWVVRRGRFFPYPIALLGMLFDELGDGRAAENVVFTR
jgi:FkbM family methyltransferase